MANSFGKNISLFIVSARGRKGKENMPSAPEEQGGTESFT